MNLIPVHKITQGIWDKLKECFIISQNNEKDNQQLIKNENNNNNNELIKDLDDDNFPFKGKEEGSTDGIFSGLARINKKDELDVDSSSTFIFFTPKNSIDYSNDKMFQSLNEEDSWIKFDFRRLNASINISGYSIISKDGKTDDHHLKSWNIEGSNDGETWDLIDQRRDVVDLNGPLHKRTFSVEKRNDYKILRLRITGVAHSGYWVLALSAIEFFGKFTQH